jgi:ComF family protein
MLKPLVGKKIHPAFLAYHYLWQAVDWLFPPYCGGCGSFGSRWCSDCEEKIQTIKPPLCRICGQPSISCDICDSCKSSPPSFTTLQAIGAYTGPFRKAILQLKFRNNLGLCEVFALKLARRIIRVDWHPDLVVAVPLSKQHQKTRGFNQAELLAKPLSWLINVQYASDAITRIKPTSFQVGLTAHQRKSNVKNAFFAEAGLVYGKTILLVDDIATTCSTMDSCSKALLEAGAKQVNAICLARAVLDQDTSLDTSSLEMDSPLQYSSFLGG